MVIRTPWWLGAEGQKQLGDSDLPVPLTDSLSGEVRTAKEAKGAKVLAR